MTTDEQARLKDHCRMLRKIIADMEKSDTMHEVAYLSAWAVDELMRIQRDASHRMRIMHTDLNKQTGKANA